MPAITPNVPSRPAAVTQPWVTTVGGTECVVRVTPLCPIADVLGFEHEVATTTAVDPGTIADLLDSRMITPPRLRRRRDRAVSSRAVFYVTE